MPMNISTTVIGARMPFGVWWQSHQKLLQFPASKLIQTVAVPVHCARRFAVKFLSYLRQKKNK
jgi:hypothetical protein